MSLPRSSELKQKMLKLSSEEKFVKEAGGLSKVLAHVATLGLGGAGGYAAAKSIYEGREDDRRKLQESVIEPGTALALLAAGAGAKYLYDKASEGASGEVTLSDLNSIMGRRR